MNATTPNWPTQFKCSCRAKPSATPLPCQPLCFHASPRTGRNLHRCSKPIPAHGNPLPCVNLLNSRFLQILSRCKIPPQPNPMSNSTDPSSPGARLILRIAASLTLLFFISYAVDLTWYHARLAVPRLGLADSSVHRVRLLAIPDKGNKVEYQIDAVQPEEDVPCSRTLFPHADRNPCWYVSRHAKDPIAM